MKTGYYIAGGLVLATGLGLAIYYGTHKKTESVVAQSNNQSGAGAPPSEGPIQNVLNNAQIIANVVTAFTAEKFPLRVGMKGPNVKKMQDALRTKFNQTAVKSDGLFGVKTFQALKDTGYATLAQSTISEDAFNKILAGEKKQGFMGADGNQNRAIRTQFPPDSFKKAEKFKLMYKA